MNTTPAWEKNSDAHSLDTQVNLTARANFAAKQQADQSKKEDQKLISEKTAGLQQQQAEVLATAAVFQQDADERDTLRGDLLDAQIADMNGRTQSRLVGWVDYRWRIMGHVADVPYESAKDFLTQFQENYKDEPLIEPHMMGIAQTAGGLGMFAAGAGLSATGLGALVGVPLMARGVDVVYHGGELALTGKASPTWLNQGLRKAATELFDADENTAEWVGDIGEIVIDMGLGAAAKGVQNAQKASKLAGKNCTGIGGCFVAGTEVIVGYGENGNPITKPIEEVQVGDTVLTRDQSSGEDENAPLTQGRVVSVFSKRVYDLQLVTVQGEDGSSETINATDNHPFYVENRGWIEASQLRIGDRVWTADGRELIVTANVDDFRPDGVMVYNFEVANAHTYFVADGIGQDSFVWVHNKTCPRKILDLKPGDPNQAAHVVPRGVFSNRKEAVQQAVVKAKKILEKFGIGIDDKANLFAASSRNHGGTHRDKFLLQLPKELEKVAKGLNPNKPSDVNQFKDLLKGIGNRAKKGGFL